ncbi:potassium channel family protein [Planctomycetota bacterium]
MRQVAVIGLGNFGQNVAHELVEQGAQVIAVDHDSERVEAIKDTVTYAVALNTTDEKALRSVGVHEVDVAVVCIGDDIEANMLTTILLKKMGLKRIWSRAISPLQQEILKALDVESVINLEKEMGILVARSLVIQNVVKHVQMSPGYSVAEIKVPESWAGKTLRDSKLRENYQLNVVAIKKKRPQITQEGERSFEDVIENVPSPDVELDETDILVIIGHDRDLAKFAKE